METKFTYWQDGEWFIGYLNEWPDYKTQGATLEELQENLKGIYEDVNSGELPGVRREAVLKLA